MVPFSPSLGEIICLKTAQSTEKYSIIWRFLMTWSCCKTINNLLPEWEVQKFLDSVLRWTWDFIHEIKLQWTFSYLNFSWVKSDMKTILIIWNLNNLCTADHCLPASSTTWEPPTTLFLDRETTTDLSNAELFVPSAIMGTQGSL